MVICIVALVVLAVLSLFSAKYRPLAREAFRCVARTVRLKPCDTGFDTKVKAAVTGRLMGRSPGLAGWVHRNFRALSLLFTLVFLLSIAGTVWGLANFALFGNCNGPASSGFCLYRDLTGAAAPGTLESLRQPLTLEGFSSGPEGAALTVVEYGCYSCPYTREAEPVVQQLRERGDVRVIFKPTPIPAHNNSAQAALAAFCAHDQPGFWNYHAELFDHQEEWRAGGNQSLFWLAEHAGLDTEQFDVCFSNGKYSEAVERFRAEGRAVGIYGTPTFFVNGKPLVGPQPLSAFG